MYVTGNLKLFSKLALDLKMVLIESRISSLLSKWFKWVL